MREGGMLGKALRHGNEARRGRREKMEKKCEKFS
jgi:hypothetical protein